MARFRRRGPRSAVAVLSVALLLAGCTSRGPGSTRSASSPSTTTPARPTPHPSVPPGSAIALGVVLPTAEQNAAGLDRLDERLGRGIAFTRQFLLWDSSFPTDFDQTLAARHIVVAVSVRPVRSDGSRIRWAAIADAAPGSSLYHQIVDWADRVKAFGQPMFFTFDHEPEATANDGLGSAADYVAAWRRIHTVFAAQGATNARFLQIMTSYAYLVPRNDDRYGPDWYPGDHYVDAIAADAYNLGDCAGRSGTWTSLASTIAGFVHFGAAHPTKPMYLAEFGSTEDRSRPGRKSGWIQTARNLLEQPAYSQIAGVAYYDATDDGLPRCDFPLTSSPSAAAAFVAMARDPHFDGAVRFGG